jgi:hypothetical protein
VSSPTPVHTAAQGYGNIYTPHAGSMVIQVQRELGLANRTIVLSPRKVRLLRFFTSKVGKGIAIALGLSWIVLAYLALRVPLLTNRLQNLEHTAQRLDTLETTLSRLQYRYNQVHRLLGPSAGPAANAAATGAGAASPTAAPPVAGPAGATPAASATPKTTASVQQPATSAPVYGATDAPRAAAPTPRRRKPVAAPTSAAAAPATPATAPALPAILAPARRPDSSAVTKPAP